MPCIRKVYVLQKDVKNTDKRPRKGPLTDMPDLFMEGDVFVHEVVVPKRGQAHDTLKFIDDNDLPAFKFDHGEPMYGILMRHLRRAQPSVGRLLHEYDAYAPETTPKIIEALLRIGAITLRHLEDALISHRQRNDYDLLEDDDVIALPKAGRSKCDADEGGTDPTRPDFDPHADGYAAPEDEDETSGEAEGEMTAEGGVVAAYADWAAEVRAILARKLGREIEISDEALREGFADQLEAEECADWICEQSKSKPQKVKKAKKAKKKKTKDAGLAGLADDVYTALAQTPGKTRKLTTLAELVGAPSETEVYRAMDLLAQQGKIDDKGRVIIIEGKE